MQQRCTDRIATELQEREQAIAELFRREDYDGLSELPLGISSHSVTKIDLSWGGPADWLEVWRQGEDIGRVIYHFADWFDHAEEEVRKNSLLWQAVEYYIGGLNTEKAA